jgi:hypothetical protein
MVLAMDRNGSVLQRANVLSDMGGSVWSTGRHGNGDIGLLASAAGRVRSTALRGLDHSPTTGVCSTGTYRRSAPALMLWLSRYRGAFVASFWVPS